MEITKRHLPKSQFKRPIAYGNKTHITVHSTGNDRSTAKNEVDYLHRPDNKTYTSYHYAVGDDVIYEVIPPGEVAYHAGNRVGNWNSIGIEMVHTGNREKVLANTIWLIKHLQKKFNISNDKVVRHYDWVMRENGYSYQKNCPVILNNDGKWTDWYKFKERLEKRSVLDTMTKEELLKLIQTEIQKAVKPSSKEKDENHWIEPEINSLKESGVEFHDKRYDDLATRSEVIAIAKKISENL